MTVRHLQAGTSLLDMAHIAEQHHLAYTWQQDKNDMQVELLHLHTCQLGKAGRRLSHEQADTC